MINTPNLYSEQNEIQTETVLEKNNFSVKSVLFGGKEVPIEDRRIIDMPMSTSNGDGIAQVKIAPTGDIWMYEGNVPERLKGEQLFLPAAFFRETERMGKKLPNENKKFMKYIRDIVKESQKGNKEPYAEFAKQNTIKPCGIRLYGSPYKEEVGSLFKVGKESQILTGNVNKKGEVQVMQFNGRDMYLSRESPKFAYSGRCLETGFVKNEKKIEQEKIGLADLVVKRQESKTSDNTTVEDLKKQL